MKLFTWNIQAGGGRRMPQILTTIYRHVPDLIVLTEYRQNSLLESSLRSEGWEYVITTKPFGRKNGVLIASKGELVEVDHDLSGPNDGLRWKEVWLPDQRFGLIGLHIPNSSREQPERKPAFWEGVLRLAHFRKDGQYIMMGDFNTGDNRWDKSPKGSTFHCSEFLALLSEIGWVDVWRRQHPSAREYTWFSRTKDGLGNGFRIDHMYITRSLMDRWNWDVHYYHHEREAGESDHSILMAMAREKCM